MTENVCQKRQRKYLLLVGMLTLLPVLYGCTGTQQPAQEILFALAAGDTAATAHIALVATQANQGSGVALGVLPESRRPLPAPPIDVDVVDRRNLRTELVMLTRLLEPTNPLATVLFFNIEALNAEDLAGFVESRDRLDITLDSLRIAPWVSPLPTSFCPIDLEVGSQGRYLALMSEQSQCNRSDLNAIDIIDLEDPAGPTIIAHIETPVLTRTLFLAQLESRGGLRDIVYFFQEEAGDPALYAVPMPLPDGDSTEPKPQALDIAVASNVGNSIVDFAPQNDNYVVLREQSFIVIPDSGGTLSEPAESTSVATIANAQQVVRNDFRSTDQVLILSNDTLAVHRTTTDADEQTTRLRDAIGIVEPLNRFAYFFRGTTLSRFDLLAYQDAINSSNFVNFTVEGLADLMPDQSYAPRTVTWIQARLETITP